MKSWQDEKGFLEYNIPFVVHTGDFVTYGYDWGLWQKDFLLLHEIFCLLRFFIGYRKSWCLSTNVLSTYGCAHQILYHKRYGYADFIAPNSHIPLQPDTEQMKWSYKLESYKQQHHGKSSFSSSFFIGPDRKPGYDPVRLHIVPLLEKYGIFGFAGHDIGMVEHQNQCVMYLTSEGGVIVSRTNGCKE